METPVVLIEALLERTENFTKISYELAKLKSVETTTKVVNSIVVRVFVVAMILLFLLVLTIGIALLLGEVLGKMYFGFFIVAGFYLVLGLLFHFFLYFWIKKPLSNILISKMLH